MATMRDVELSLLWQGDGELKGDDTLLAPMALFIARGVVPGDAVELTSPAGKQMMVEVLAVSTDDALIVHATPGPDQVEAVLPVGPVSIRVLRRMDRPCPVCERKGVVKELIAARVGEEVTLTHLHCSWCEAEMSADHGTINCEGCMATVRERLLRDHTDLDQEMKLFGGKRVIKVRPRTVEDGDAIQSFQDAMVLGNPGLSTQYVLNETKKAALALTLEDDGQGKKPSDLVTATDMTPRQRVLLMGKHFKGMNQGYYNALLSALGRYEALIEDACRYRIDETYPEEELLILSEAIATSPTPVTGTVSLWDGAETLEFVVPTTDQLEEADAMAETIIQENKDHMMEGRAKFIIAWCRTACHFKGDSKVTFKEETTYIPGPDGKPVPYTVNGLEERMQYIGTLPIALYYLYLSASNVWQRRVARASDVEVVGKS